MIARGYQQKQTEKNEPVLLNFDWLEDSNQGF